MVDENISSGYLRLKFHHRRPARRDKCGLHIAHGLGGTFRVDLVKNLPNHMEARHKVRAVIAENIRTVSPTLAFSARSLASDPLLPLKTTKSGVSCSILSTAASCTPLSAGSPFR